MEVQYKILLDDIINFNIEYEKHPLRTNRRIYLFYWLCFFLFQWVFLTIYLVFRDYGLILLPFIIFFDLSILIHRRKIFAGIIEGRTKDYKPIFNKLCTLRVQSEGADYTIGTYKGWVPWSEVTEVLRTKTFFWMKSCLIGFIIPRSVFSSKEEFEVFAGQVEQHQKNGAQIHEGRNSVPGKPLRAEPPQALEGHTNKRTGFSVKIIFSLIAVIIITIILLYLWSVFGPSTPHDVTKNFWVPAIYGHQQPDMGVVTKDLYARIDAEEWERIIDDLSLKTGPNIKFSLKHDSRYSESSSDGTSFSYSIVSHRIVGEKSRAVIRTILYKENGQWKINGFEIYNFLIDRKPYLSPEDQGILSEKQFEPVEVIF